MRRDQGKLVRRFSLASLVAALSLVASASPAGAAVTIGQTGPPTNAASDRDRLQPTVTSGNGYVVPDTVPNWTVTSWSTQSVPAGGVLTMKIFRSIGGLDYVVVGHDGPRTLIPDTLNTFPVNVPVRAGDVLGNGVPAGAAENGCRFIITGEQFLQRDGYLADGEFGSFTGSSFNQRLNISAIVSPTNAFKLGHVARNKRKGTATLTVNDLPNPGELTASGKGVKGAGAAVIGKAVTPGTAKLLIKAKGKKKRKLNEKGQVKLNLAITYTPTGGDAASQSIKVKLKKNL